MVFWSPTFSPAFGPRSPLHHPSRVQVQVKVLKVHPASAACDIMNPAHLGFQGPHLDFLCSCQRDRSLPIDASTSHARPGCALLLLLPWPERGRKDPQAGVQEWPDDFLATPRAFPSRQNRPCCFPEAQILPAPRSPLPTLGVWRGPRKQTRAAIMD